MASNKRHFKMWARYGANNILIPGSNIWAKKAPAVGNWVEIQAYECCNYTTTTTTTQPIVPSDINLKEEITATGGTIGEFGEYTWKWNSTAKALGFGNFPERGVLAQEVVEKRPDAIVYNMGYMMVRYDLIN